MANVLTDRVHAAQEARIQDAKDRSGSQYTKKELNVITERPNDHNDNEDLQTASLQDIEERSAAQTESILKPAPGRVSPVTVGQPTKPAVRAAPLVATS